MRRRRTDALHRGDGRRRSRGRCSGQTGGTSGDPGRQMSLREVEWSAKGESG
jgi:hypothetical protein